MAFLIIIAVLLVIFFLYGSSRYILDKVSYRLPPGPTPVPFLGNFLNLAPQKGSKKKVWHFMQDLAKQYGPAYTFYFGQYRAIVLSDSDLIHEVLVNQSKTFSWRMDTFIVGFENIGYGIISSNHDLWRKNRRFGMRAMRDFGMGRERMVHNIHDEISHFIPELQGRSGQPFNPRRLLTNTVSNVICGLVFGQRFNYNDPKFLELLAQIEVIVTRSVNASAVFLSLPFVGRFVTPFQVQDFNAIQKLTTRMVDTAIREHRRDFDLENIRDFPDLFIAAENKEDAMDLESFGLVMTDMFVAGTETTSTALQWTLLFLATWPDIQTKCQEAIDSVIESDRLPTLADRPQLVYVDAVMCEVLRYTSLVPNALFHSNLDAAAKIAGYDCPPWTFVVYNVSDLHWNKKYWGDPEKFRPERWIDEKGKLLSHSSHFLPFGLGPRVCLGESLARVEYFIFITAMLHRFNFSLKRPVDVDDGRQGVVHSPPDYEIIVEAR